MKLMAKKYEDFLDLVIYQIYPKSFKDTNGDGIGDIPGIIEKLDYLQELGVNALWLCPCYKSPNHDNGYDIADYRTIGPEFGTNEDIKKLISEMHSRNMKLIMDLVPNHTSDEHEWFIKSRNGDEKYRDYYYWFDEPQNDWGATFGGSAWQYDEKRKQYYLHSYAVQQPDLNWTNPDVVKEMQAVVDYWVDLGVDGFRCDVIDQISKNFDGFNGFGPHLHEYIHDLFGRENVKNIFTVGECWADEIDEICRHIAFERGELSTLFQFAHLESGRKNGKFTPAEKNMKAVRDTIVKWQLQMQDLGLLHSLFTDNHDNTPFISRAADDKALRYESATCIAAMFYLLRGIPFIYQGQEFGLANSFYDSIDDYNDIECINEYNVFLKNGLSKEDALKRIAFGSRDNARRPFAWDNSEYNGFSTHEPWLPIASRSNEINLKSDRESQKSVFKFYQKLLKLRREEPALRKGITAVLSKPEDEYFIYTREYEGKKFTVICNFEQDSKIENISEFGKEVLANYSDREIGTASFRPYETVVFSSDISEK